MYVLRVGNMNFSAAVQKAKAIAEEIKTQEEEKMREAEEKTRQFANSVAGVKTQAEAQEREKMREAEEKTRQFANSVAEVKTQAEAEQNARRVAGGVEPGGGSGAFGAIMTFVFGEHWFTYSIVIAGIMLMLYVRKQLNK